MRAAATPRSATRRWVGHVYEARARESASYQCFKTVGADGKPLEIAPRDAGSNTDPVGEFLPGRRVDAHPHRDDPQSCYRESVAIGGDSAVEQAVLTIPPTGGYGSLVPHSLREDFARRQDHA